MLWESNPFKSGVLSRYTFGNIAENLIGRTVGEAGMFEGIHAEPFVRPQNNDFVAYIDAGNAGDVDEC